MRYRGLSLIVTLLLAVHSEAQTGGVWDNGKKSFGNAKAKAGKKVSAIKSWKDHLQRWGLDSSYKYSLALGGRLNSDGWSGGIFYGHKKFNNSVSLWQLTLSEVKGEKETKQQRTSSTFPELGSGTPYIYGKINNLYLLQLGYGHERMLLPAVLEGNVSVGFRYSGGFSLAMLKPYDLKLIYPDYSVSPAVAVERDETYSDQNRDQFLNANLILGRGGWSKGLSEMKYAPGLYGETALMIMPRKGRTFIQVITLGISGAFFTNDLPVMVDIRSFPWRGCLFAGFEVGKQWE